MEQFYFPLAAIFDSIDSLVMDETEAEDVFKDATLFAALYPCTILWASSTVAPL